MAKIRIKGDTSGYVDLEAPDAASSSTLDLDQVPQKNSANVFTTAQTIQNDNSYWAANIAESSHASIALRVTPTRAGYTKGISLGAIGKHSALSTGIQAYDTSDNSSNTLELNPHGGAVTAPSQPSFYVYASGGGIASSNSYTTPGFDNVSHNIGNHWSTSTVTFTAPVAGLYYFHFAMYWNSTNGYSRIRILKNSSTIHHYNIKPGTGSDHSQEVSGIISMAANDTVKPQMMSDNSNNYFRSQNHTYFEGYLLG
jgi:hypothetical protein